MADIKIKRSHNLGLPKARALAFRWAEQAEQQLSMECTYVEGDTTDEVQFSRSGVTGSLAVTGKSFDLEARLGFLVSAFKSTIESEIEKNLDALLQGDSGAKARAKPAIKSAGARKKG